MTTITDQQKLTILKHLATGKPTEVTATIVHVDHDQVREVARHHGWPDREKLSWAVDIVAKKIAEAAADALPPVAQGRPITPAPRPAAPTPAPRPTAVAAPVAAADSIAALIQRGHDHDRAPIRKQAERAADQVAKLRELIAADAEAYAERQRVEKEKAEARALVEKLEADLAEARAKLRGGAPAPATDGPSAAEVRAWARDNDVACPGTGRVPRDVRDAYAKAHEAVSA